MPSQPKINSAPADTSKVNPEVQETFDMFIINGMELIYDEKHAKSMLPRLGAGTDPTKAMAELLVDIITRVVSSAKQAGKEIPPEVVLHGGNFLFGELLKVLEAAGMAPMSEEQKTSVWQMASSIYIDRMVKSGEMTKEELARLSSEVKQTAAGKKVMKTAKDPEKAIADLKDTGAESAEPVVTAPSPQVMSPDQGGM